jgi:WD40 repeat protein
LVFQSSILSESDPSPSSRSISATEAGGVRLSAFFSYAREDSDVCTQLKRDLTCEDLTVTGDWDLTRGEDYEQELAALIRDADIVVALVSPGFAASDPCRGEIAQATSYGKRILPLIVHNVPHVNVLPEVLRSRQWTFLRSAEEYAANLPSVRTSLRTDVAELRAHRDLLQAAERWGSGDGDAALLLRDRPLMNATAWLERARARDPRFFPQPTETQVQFIVKGNWAERRRHRRNWVLAVTALIAAAAGGWVIRTSSRAATSEQQGRIRQEEINQANSLAREAAALGTDYRTEVELRVLLAVKSLTIAPTPEADRVLRESVSLLPGARSATPFQPGEQLATFSDDAQFIATTQPDRTVHIYGTSDMRKVSVLKATSDIRQVVISDNHTVAILRDDGYDLFDLKSGNQENGGYRLRRDPATALPDSSATAQNVHVALSRSADYVAFTDGSSVTVRQPTELHPVMARTIEGAINEVTFSPDAKLIALKSIGVSVLEVATQRSVFSDSTAETFAFSPDGQRLAVYERSGEVDLIDLATGRPAGGSARILNVMKLLFDDTNRWLAAVLPNGVRILGASDVNVQLPVDTGSYTPELVTFTRDGSAVAVTNGQRATFVWDLSDGQIRSAIWDNDSTAGVASMNTGELIVVTKPAGSTKGDKIRSSVTKVRVPGRRRLPYRSDDNLYGIAYSPETHRVAIAHGDGRIGIYDALTGQVFAPIRRDGRITGLGFARGGALLAAASAQSVDVFDVASQKTLLSVPTGSEPGWVSIDDHGTVVAASSPNHTVRLYSLPTGKLEREFPQKAEVETFFLDPAGTRIGIATADNRARIYDVATGREVTTLMHTDTVNSVVFSHDGSLVATASDDYTTQLWDLNANARRLTIGSPDRPWYAGFSPKGSRLVSVDRDQRVRVYALPGGALTNVIAVVGETMPVFADDDHLLTMWQVGDKLEIREHSLLPADVIAAACSLLQRDFDDSEWNQYFFGKPRRATCPATASTTSRP